MGVVAAGTMGMALRMVVGVVVHVAMIMGMIMRMRMFVPVKRQRPLGASAEQRAVFRRIGDDLGGAFATDMTVQA